MIIQAKAWAGIAILVVAAVAVSPSVKGLRADGSQARVVVRAEVIDRRVVYTVDSHPVVPDLLRVLSLLREERGDGDVVALVDDKAPIEEIGTIDGVAGKAGFSSVRFFVFNKDTRRMSAIEFGPDMPYSTNPPKR